MEISGKEQNGWSILQLDGSFDLHTIHDVKNIFKHLSTQGRNVLVDFTNVKNIDSSGVSCLVFCQKLLHKNEISLRIAGINSKVRVIFQITRGFEIFDIFDEVDVALEAEAVIYQDKVA